MAQQDDETLTPSGLLALPSIYDRSAEPGVMLMRHVREQLATAGLPRSGGPNEPGAEISGLVPRGAFGDTGFSVQELSQKELEFHIVISGKSAGIEYKEWSDWQAGVGAMRAHEPVNQKSLQQPIRDAFRDMGFEVKKVKNDSFEKYDNDDLTYNVITDYPDILKISVGESSDKLDGVSREWDAFFDSVKPIKKI
ncbi:MAG: hypothetical protein HUJ29_03690 [Gammaproteobacteria bacterium]|nr:hypothetical protein [Gammaproteobacteria bacterium]